MSKTEWALVTGPSSGIGRELAKLLAADHYNLVLVSRDQARLQSLADELSSLHKIETRVIPKDLALTKAPSEIFAALSDLPISILVNNAGFGSHGSFADLDLANQLAMIQVNVTSLVELTHRFVRPMIARRHGKILNVASVAAFQPGPTVNCYYATKAFVYSFSYALADELEATGITVTALCPGTTQTEFFERANIRMKRPWKPMDATTVAQAGYRAMLKGKRVIIPGFLNRMMSTLSPCAPSRWTSGIVRRLHEKE